MFAGRDLYDKVLAHMVDDMVDVCQVGSVRHGSCAIPGTRYLTTANKTQDLEQITYIVICPMRGNFYLVCDNRVNTRGGSGQDT